MDLFYLSSLAFSAGMEDFGAVAVPGAGLGIGMVHALYCIVHNVTHRMLLVDNI